MSYQRLLHELGYIQSMGYVPNYLGAAIAPGEPHSQARVLHHPGLPGAILPPSTIPATQAAQPTLDPAALIDLAHRLSNPMQTQAVTRQPYLLGVKDDEFDYALTAGIDQSTLQAPVVEMQSFGPTTVQPGAAIAVETTAPRAYTFWEINCPGPVADFGQITGLLIGGSTVTSMSGTTSLYRFAADSSNKRVEATEITAGMRISFTFNNLGSDPLLFRLSFMGIPVSAGPSVAHRVYPRQFGPVRR